MTNIIISFILISIVIVINGATDAANAIISGVSTKTLSYKKAILVASVFNFLGVIIMTTFNKNVVITIFNIVEFDKTYAIIALTSSLLSIIIWTTIAWYFGIPTSESHALIAGISGAGVAVSNNLNCINIESWIKVIIGLIISLSLGILVGYFIYIIRKKNTYRTMVFSTAFISFMHGAQDGQKFIGLYLLVLSVNNLVYSNILVWLMILSSILMGFGTLIGGKRIVDKMGSELIKLDLRQGIASDISTSLVLLFTTLFGIPISTTHVKMTSIMGAGMAKKNKLNISVIKQLILTWLLTFPGCGIISFLLTKVLIK